MTSTQSHHSGQGWPPSSVFAESHCLLHVPSSHLISTCTPVRAPWGFWRAVTGQQLATGAVPAQKPAMEMAEQTTQRERPSVASVSAGFQEVIIFNLISWYNESKLLPCAYQLLHTPPPRFSFLVLSGGTTTNPASLARRL